jgi:methionyl-tRNA formyltransferase
VPPLRAIVEAGHDVRLVVTQPDKRRGRGASLLPSPVKAEAQALGLEVTERVDDVMDAGAELGVVVAFGQLIKPHVLAAVPMINVHFSLLPRWRGAAPVERAILAGDTETGVCLMTLEQGLDTGPVHAREVVPIGPDESADELRAQLVEIGTGLLLVQLADGLGPPVPQQGDVTYAAKIDPDELHLDWTQSAVQLHRVVRLGRAWTTFRGKRLRVREARVLAGSGSTDGRPGLLDGLTVGTGDGSLELMKVQPEGREPMPAFAWRNGARPAPGERLGS